MARKAHPMLVLLLIILVFALPYLVAKFLLTEDMIGHPTSYGDIIQPSFLVTKWHLYNSKGQRLQNEVGTKYRAPSATRTTGDWLLLYVHHGKCHTRCEKALYNMRQIRLALGKNVDRLQRAILTFGKTNRPALAKLLSGPYKGTYHLHANKALFNSVVKKQVKAPYATNNNAMFVIDPLGNVMMVYPPKANPNKVFKDIYKLLKVSQIG